MAKIISFTHSKGGVAKTTMTLNLYDYFIKSGCSAGILDLDLQGSITDLLKAFKDHEYINILDKDDSVSLESILDKYNDLNYILIDTPPYLTNELPDIFDCCDLIIAPCKASPLDAIAIESTLELIREAQGRNPLIKASILMTMAVTNTEFTNDVKAILEEKDFPIMETIIYNRICYARSLVLSNSVLSDDNKLAKKEVESFASEVLNLL